MLMPSKATVRSFWQVLVLLCLTGTAGAVDFKGIEIGRPLGLSKERAVFGTLDCNPVRLTAEEYKAYVQEMQYLVPGVRQICSGSTSVATIPADATVLLGTARRVLRLTFQFTGDEYRRVLKAMTTKWGEGIPEVRAEHDESVWWDFEDGATVSVHQLPSEDDEHVVGLVEYSVSVTTPDGDL
jgi:hypothetical protein